MKQLLLATATLVGMSAAALAAEPVALTDSQLDNVTAGQAVSTSFPVAVNNLGAAAAGGGAAAAVLATAFAANPQTQSVTP